MSILCKDFQTQCMAIAYSEAKINVYLGGSVLENWCDEICNRKFKCKTATLGTILVTILNGINC
jgi:hypothetical protein